MDSCLLRLGRRGRVSWGAELSPAPNDEISNRADILRGREGRGYRRGRDQGPAARAVMVA
jgi:hypothetical protein